MDDVQGDFFGRNIAQNQLQYWQKKKKKRVPLRAETLFMRKKMGHTAVSAFQNLSVTF